MKENHRVEVWNSYPNKGKRPKRQKKKKKKDKWLTKSSQKIKLTGSMGNFAKYYLQFF